MVESFYTPLCPLDGGHDRGVFDCGVPPLNLYLRNYAMQNQNSSGIVCNYVTTHKHNQIVEHGFETVLGDPLKLFLPVSLSR